MPTISVIVPVYKVEKYIHRCIDSILAQTFADFELLLVDDGSPDNCGAICDEYAGKDSRVRVIHKQNGGVSAARNDALDIAMGDYIAFCDSDDYWDDNWLQSLWTRMRESDADLVTADYTYFMEDDNSGTIHRHEKGTYQLSDGQQKLDFIIEKILGGKLGWEIWTKLFKREIIEDHAIRFCETCENFAEDLGFVLEYSLYCKRVDTCDSSGYFYVQHEGSMMSGSRTSVKLNALNEVSRQFGKRFFALYRERGSSRQFAVMHYLIMNNQYSRIVLTDRYPFLPDEIGKISDKKWYRRHTRAAFGAYRKMTRYLGKEDAQKALLLSSFCLHESWRLHGIISYFFYKYFYIGRAKCRQSV